MGGGGSKQQVVDYYLSCHLGWCFGPVDEIAALWVGEKKAWSGSVTNSSSVTIDNKGLFGGNKVEGGVAGAMHVFNNGKTGKINDTLARKLGGLISNLPNFRNQLTTLFCGTGQSDWLSGGAVSTSSITGRSGFYWGSNNAYIKAIWLDVRRFFSASQYEDTLGTAAYTFAYLSRIGDDYNPAVIILEVFINKVWGMGLPIAMIDIESFQFWAQKLYDEDFGISLVWNDASDASDFIQDVLNHVNGVVYTSTLTGKVKLRLMREVEGDYTQIGKYILDSNVCKITSYQKKSYSETVNEVVVKYTSSDNEDMVSVSAQNLANINVQGGINSYTVEYRGIRNATLAQKVASRDCRILSTPLIGLEVEVNYSAMCRAFWNDDKAAYRPIEPGDVVYMVFPEYAMNEMAFRVGEVKYGTVDDRKLTLTLTEDVFTAGHTTFTPQQPLDATNYDLPSSLDDVYLEPASYGTIARVYGTSVAAEIDYPDCPFLMLISENDDISSAETNLSVGGGAYKYVGNSYPQGKFTLANPIGFDTTTVLTLANQDGHETPKLGDTVLIGSPSVALDRSDIELVGSLVGKHTYELAYVTDISLFESDGKITVSRGVFDTVPFAWPIGTDVRMMASDLTIIPEGAYGTDTVASTYKLFPRNNNGQLMTSPEYQVVGSDRMYLPYRPGNVRFNGNLWPLVAQFPLTVTWEPRNRKIDTGTPLHFDAAGVTAEAGTTYKLRLEIQFSVVTTDAQGNPVTTKTAYSAATIDGISDLQYVIDATTLQPYIDAINTANSTTYTFSQVSAVAIALWSHTDAGDSYVPFQWKVDITP